MKLTSTPFHPFLFAIFPILFLYANNFFQVSAEDLIITLAISTAFTITLWFIIKQFIKNKNKSGIIISLCLVLFFSYGHIFIAVNNIDILGFDTGNQIQFSFIFLLISGAIILLALFINRPLDNATKISNGISVTLIALVLFNIGILGIGDIANPENENYKISSLNNGTNNTPDIYYLVFDSYANHNTLKTQFDFDNNPFLEYLDSRNFIIPSATHSNYPSTSFSLPSSLHMQYLDIEKNPTTLQESYFNPGKIMDNNKSMKKLKEKGYEIISFNSGFSMTDAIKIVDIYYCDSNILNSEFVGMIIRTSMLNPLHVLLFEHDFRYGINCIFDTIPNLKDEYDKPIFVFAHIMIPHPPYVFGPDGETVNVESLSFTEGWDDKKGYVDQVKYANKRMTGVVDAILSDESPIIIIQSDHGPRIGIDYVNPTDEMYAQSFGILNAYHLPGCNDSIYDSISPINSFRVIFNCYFDEDYELLDDKAYWTTSNGTIIKVDPRTK